jgi:hypothetical protein
VSGFAYLMPVYWFEDTFHPEAPATGQLDQKFSLVFLGPTANAKFVPTSQVAMLVSHAALLIVTSTFRSNLTWHFTYAVYVQCLFRIYKTIILLVVLTGVKLGL